MSSPALSPVCPQPGVLFVVPGDGQGSSMIFVRRQAHSLATEGIPTNLFYLASRTSPGHLLADFLRFRSEIKQLCPAVIHAHFGTVTALFSALACGALPLVITYRGGDLNPAPQSYSRLSKARAACGYVFSQLAALRAQKIICVSHPLRNRLWWRRAAVTILPTGVDPAVFHPEPRALVRRRLGWTDTERVVLFNAGHDAKGKRVDLAKAAVERARGEIAAVRLEILDGSVGPALVPDLMNASDCLLLTSVSEGSPTVVQEALACDLPVVSVEVGDVMERFEGVSNAVVSAPDPAALGRALATMLEPPRRSNGSLKVAEFSSQRIAAQLTEIYRKLAAA
ncbi:MAG: glycosyltransferase [Bryobacteraceae bacterium]